MNFLKSNVCSLFFLSTRNHDGHIAGLMEAKPEELGKICQNRKDMPFYVLQFCIHANFLLVQSLRRYDFFKKIMLVHLLFSPSKIVKATLRAL